MVKFLIVRFSSIGDIVLTTPVIRCLKKQVKGAEVHFLTKSKYADVLKSNPYIDKLHLLGDNYPQLLKSLRQEKIDYIIDLHRNLRTLRLKQSLRKLSISVDKLNLKKWLLVNFRYDILPPVHIVDRYLSTLKLFSVENDGEGLDYFIPGNEVMDTSFVMESNKAGYITIVVGGGHQTKQLPVKRIMQLIEGLNFPVVLLGGNDDIEKADAIVSAITHKSVYNLVGKLSINQSASLIQQSKLVITPDTGLMHIAAAFRKDIVSVWGNTVPEFGMFPYNPGRESEIFEVRNLPCRPCSKIGYSKCPRGHFKCMEDQDYFRIIQKVKKLITD